ncbi:response regulator transcription factor [Peribacillus tepidiphilus]|uniref:response regulator transcription factor n=1 Tax=Peribacillus tepidiphilus TaxID=2652445 RepID=UPI0012909561|nr:response regulator transcription factor [Peribacillus tepidiphilus]
MNEYTVLVVDDEEDMRNLIEMYLLNSGYKCIQAEDGKKALEKLHKHRVDVILLDIMMPNLNGFEVCEIIRKTHQTPIIFISAKGEEWDKVKGLKLGGDDYVVKPFSPGELMARIEALLRRTGKLGQDNETDIIQFHEIALNQKSRKVTVHNKPVNLTLKEYELLLFFIKHEGQVLSREQLLENIWGIDYDGSLRTVDTHIKTLRMKLKTADYIQTVWGIGYKLEGHYAAK